MHNGKHSVLWCNPQTGGNGKEHGTYGRKEIYVLCSYRIQ